MSREKKRTLISAVVAVVAIGGGWWAYMTFSTVPPPDLNSAKVDEVVGFMGNPNGFARLNVDQREQYFTDAYQRFSSYDDRVAINRRFAQMTDREKTVFMDASFEVFKDRFIEEARTYNKLNRAEKQRFVDDAIKNMENMQAQLTGGGGGAPVGPSGERIDLGNPFQDLAPRTPDEFMVRVSKLTTPKERDEGRQLFEDVAARSKQLDSDPRERERFRSASAR
jgi:hypothetical protein